MRRRGYLARLTLAAALVLTGAAHPSHPVRKVPYPMLNGDWQIMVPQPSAPDRDENSFLPPGTRLRIAVQGPTRHAIEEERTDQLGGQITILPPFSATICHAAAARHACRSGHPVDPGAPIVLEASITLSTWTRPEVDAPENELFRERGAKLGSRFALVVTDDAEWQLWLRAPGMMMGQYLGVDRSGHSVAVEQQWVRPAP